jgi:uncharacterized beta barrel domain-containing protein DUF5777
MKRPASCHFVGLALSGLVFLLFLSTLSFAEETTDATQAPPPASSGRDDREIDPAQPDFVVVNQPTNLRLPNGSFATNITHRFSRPLGEGDFSDLLADFFGLDTGAIIGLGLRYGLLDGTQLGVYRTSERHIQFYVNQDLMQQGDRPLSLGLIGSVEGLDNFTEIYAPSAALVISRRLGTRGAVYLVPTAVANVSYVPGEGDDGVFMLGLGARFVLGKGVALLAEWTPRLSGYDATSPINPLELASNAYSFGLEKRVGGHAFQLNFSNTFATTPRTLARGGAPGEWFIGFNIGRKFY